ncbi:MAG: roadblock/LC7 domain-containing protein [Thermoplasmata archaeon]
MTAPSEGGVGGRLSEILSSLRSIQGVRGAAIARQDGLVVFHSLPPGFDPDKLAAIAAAVFGTGEMSSREMDQGLFQRCMMEAEEGKIIYVGAGPDAIIATVVEREANLGLILLALEKATEEVKEVLRGI